MKRKVLNKSLLNPFTLAVPAAMLMLGACHGGTIALNLDSYYYDSQATNGVYVAWTPGATRAPDGFGLGYQTSGWVVTAKAFGVVPADWFYAEVFAWWGDSPVDVIANKGTIAAHLTAPHCLESGIGTQIPGWHPQTVAPGNDQVTYTALMFQNGVSPAVSLSGLAANYPNGYVVQTIAAWRGLNQNFNGVTFTDGATSTYCDYTTIYNRPAPSDGADGTIGLSAPSGTFTSDTLNINCDPQTTGSNAVLSGFVLTDKPVMTRSYPANTLTAVGGSFVLSASVVGIETLSYQWQKENTASPGTFTNVPGGTFLNYTNAAAAAADAGNYQLIVTGSRFPSSPATSDVLVVAVIPTHPARTATWDANAGTTGAQDGSGTWSYTLTNWWSGSVDDYWGPSDSAIFGVGGAGPYTVTLADNITANAITINSGGYTITNRSNQTLALGSAAGITANAAATIGAPLSAGTNILLKAGTGAVTLFGAMDSAQTFVKAGSLEVLAKRGDSAYIVTNSATLKIGYSTGGNYASTAMQIYGDGVAATTGFYLKGGQNYNCSGQVQLLGAPTTIRQYGTGLAGLGTFDINGNGIWCTAAASGSATETNIQMVSSGYGMSAQIDPGANTTTGDLIINGPLNIPGVFGFVKRGTGSLRLNAAALAGNGALDIRAGTVICGINNCVGANAGLKFLAGTTLDFKGTSQTATNATLAGTVKMTINKGGTPKNTVLTTTDASTALNLGGELSVTNIGGALVIGDTFTLFNNLGGFYGTAFTSLNLPPLGDGQAWRDNTAVDGTIKVIAGSVAPTITTDLPTGTTYAYVGAKFTLSVVASGDPILHYHWYRNGTTAVGTDSPTLALSSVTALDTGDYSVTVSNPYGSAPSATTHHLTVEVVPSSYPAAVMQDAPFTYYPLGETLPLTAYDYSGAAHDGTQNGGLTLDVAGPRPPTYAGFSATNKAYQFDGATTYVDCGAGAALSGTTDFTLEAWVNTTNTTYGVILQQRSGYNGEYMFGVNADGTVAFMVWGGGAQQFSFSSPVSAKKVNDGNWHYVAAVRSGASGAIYIDGSPAGTASGPLAPLDPTFTVAIGRDARDDVSYFNGLMCGVAIYNHALSSTRIAVHALTGLYNSPVGIVSGPGSTSYTYVGGSPTFSVVALGDPVLHYQWKKNGTTPIGTDSTTLTLPSVTLADSADYSVTVTNLAGSAQSGTNHLTVLSPTGNPALVMASTPSAYWPLGEAAGPTAFDYAGNHNASYSSAGLTYGVPGPVGANVVAVNGTNGQVAYSYSSGLNPSGPFTVEAWLNPANVGGTMCPLASFHEQAVAEGRSGWLIYSSTAGWNFRTYNQNGQTFAVNLTGGTPTAGTWNHVAGVWDGSKGYLYVNGALQGTSPATNFVANPDRPLTIGSRSDSAFYWGGSVGDVAFYNRALSAQEIQSQALNRPILTLTPAGASIVLTWPTGTLQAAPEATGTYTNVPSATSPWPVTPSQARTFYRLVH